LEIVEEFLAEIREKFDKKSTKVRELRLLEQGEKIVEEYIQIFKKTTRYEKREEFKRSLNIKVRRRLMEIE